MDAEIVVELLSRIKALERDVAELKQKITEMENASHLSDNASLCGNNPSLKMSSEAERKRDTTRYTFEGAVYSKKRLVYAVVKRYISDHPEVSCADLKRVFDKSLQGSIGVVEKAEIARLRGEAEYRVRFFADEDEIFHLHDGDIVVCTQWGILNIPRFLTIARQMGYQISAIS